MLLAVYRLASLRKVIWHALGKLPVSNNYIWKNNVQTIFFLKVWPLTAVAKAICH